MVGKIKPIMPTLSELRCLQESKILQDETEVADINLLFQTAPPCFVSAYCSSSPPPELS